jgi:hypothetical protein
MMNQQKRRKKILPKKNNEETMHTPSKQNMLNMNNRALHQVDFKPYPEITSEDFYQDIYEKKEFRDHEIQQMDIHDESSCNPQEFKLSPFQSFLKNYISVDTPYNGILVMYSTGVGKTCAAISIAEGFKKTLKKLGKRILVLTTLRKNFENELFSFKKENDLKKSSDEVVQCTGRDYELPPEFKHYSIKQKKQEVLKMIRSYYQFFGYQKFANYVMKMTNGWDGTEEKITDQIKRFIHKEFDDRVIIIDEVHNIKTDVKNELDKAIQPILLSIMKYANNTKLVLMSATPMFDVPEEIIFILNLLLVNDKREAVRKEDIFRKDGTLQEGAVEVLSRLIKGYVSYARGEKPLQFPFRLYPEDAVIPNMEFYMSGKRIEEDKKLKFTKIVPCEMESVQNATYLHYLDKKLREGKLTQAIEVEDLSNVIEDNELNQESNVEEAGKEEPKKKKKKEVIKEEMMVNENKSQPKSILDSLTYISTIVYPTIHKDDDEPRSKDPLSQFGSFGKEGIDNQTDNGKGGYYKVTQVQEKSKYVQYRYQSHAVFDEKLNKVPFADEKYLKRYSTKYFKILQELKRAEGLCFVYSRYVDDGILPLALMLEQNGFERVTTEGEHRLLDVSVYGGQGKVGKRPPICYKCGLTFKEGDHNPSEKDSHLFKPARYILFFGEAKDIIKTTKEAALEKFTSKTNKYGEEIKVFLGTRTVSEGLDFKRLREVHILQPWFNLSRHEQIIGRAIRNCSHRDLPIEHRNVEIFQYAAVLDHRTKGVKQNMETVDLKYYRLAENKDRIIKKITRLLKESAVDCNLFKKHNVITSNEKFKQITASGQELIVPVKDEPFSSMCDYEEDCEFKCKWQVDPHKTYPINTDTYNLRFASQDIEQAKRYIKDLYRHDNVYHLGDIEKFVQENNEKMDRLFIYAALDDFIRHPKRELVIDKFNRKGYLIYRGDYYIFQPMGLKEDLPMIYREKPQDYKPDVVRLDHIDVDYKNMNMKNGKPMMMVKRQVHLANDEFFHRILVQMNDKYQIHKDMMETKYQKEYRMAIIGIILDKMKNEEFIKFMNIYLTKYWNNDIVSKKKESDMHKFVEDILHYEKNIWIYSQDLVFGFENRKSKKKIENKIVGFRLGDDYYVLKQLNQDIHTNLNEIEPEEIHFVKCNQEIMRRMKQKEELKLMANNQTNYEFNPIHGILVFEDRDYKFKIVDEITQKIKSQKTSKEEMSLKTLYSGRVCTTFLAPALIEFRKTLGLYDWKAKTLKRPDICNDIEIYLRYQQQIQYHLKTNKIYFYHERDEERLKKKIKMKK